ncbi:MAG: secondary thiamine-phosphate synthase enzyme YjbQ [Pseudomonadota bacterium]|nr:secondary thiamine-phosphate synthase enzyme YjbQ [Pseudomonadota bacterium]
MRQALTELAFSTKGVGLIEITREVAEWTEQSGVRTGLLTLLCKHTSASLLITENASSAVWSDLTAWLDRIAPQSGIYDHDSEGPDDMPAHLKNALTGVNLSIPIANGRMRLGTWQGIFLAEHRRAPHERTIALHLIGE